MTFIIGDIHGEITKLQNLILNIISVENNADFVFIGDYIDKGENSYKTLNYLLRLNQSYNCKFICGNHEYAWINLDNKRKDYKKYLNKYGGSLTLKAFGVATFKEVLDVFNTEFKLFFKILIPYWYNDKYIATHSGIDPKDYSISPENIPIQRLLFNRYDFIKCDRLYLNKYKVIFGHTGFYSPYVDNFKIGIDTAACYINDQPLTAFCPEKEFFIDSKNNQYFLNDYSINHCPMIPRNKPWREND